VCKTVVPLLGKGGDAGWLGDGDAVCVDAAERLGNGTDEDELAICVFGGGGVAGKLQDGVYVLEASVLDPDGFAEGAGAGAGAGDSLPLDVVLTPRDPEGAGAGAGAGAGDGDGEGEFDAPTLLLLKLYVLATPVLDIAPSAGNGVNVKSGMLRDTVVVCAPAGGAVTVEASVTGPLWLPSGSVRGSSA
jgi:hypothetical protein